MTSLASDMQRRSSFFGRRITVAGSPGRYCDHRHCFELMENLVGRTTALFHRGKGACAPVVLIERFHRIAPTGSMSVMAMFRHPPIWSRFVGGDPPLPACIKCSIVFLQVVPNVRPPCPRVRASRARHLSFGAGVLGRLASAVALHASKASLVACPLSTTALSHASQCSTHVLQAAGTCARSDLGFRV